MHRHTIAVEDGLDNIREMLEDEGYRVVDLEEQAKNIDAVVLTGMDDDLMGIANMDTEGFVIDASGRQPEEILYDLEKHFRMQDT
jgi:hypothetical protein